MSIIEKFSTETGKVMLGYKGYVYTLTLKTNAKSICRCQNRDGKGKLELKNDFIFPDLIGRCAIPIPRWMLSFHDQLIIATPRTWNERLIARSPRVPFSIQ
jgi:hypothetical protein